MPLVYPGGVGRNVVTQKFPKETLKNEIAFGGEILACAKVIFFAVGKK